MKTVKQVSKLANISVRTLHHYDAIGLLKPTQITDAGYRLYDDTALERLQTILLFRELQFPLKEIRTILDSPHFNRVQAMKDQLRLLELQREYLDGLIAYTREILTTGGTNMDFTAFDKNEWQAFAEEAKARWGETAAYQEYAQKFVGGTEEKTKGLMEIFAQAGQIRHLSPASQEAQALTEKLRGFISENFYNCTEEVFQGLGQLYKADQRFQENIDRAGGKGTADFVSQAISVRKAKG